MFEQFALAWFSKSWSRHVRRSSRQSRDLARHGARPLLERFEERTMLDSTGSVGQGVAVDITQPALTVNYIIAVQGIYPDRGSMSSGAGLAPMLGEIRLYTGRFAPEGWAFCDGQELSARSATALYSVLGNSFGGRRQ